MEYDLCKWMPTASRALAPSAALPRCVASGGHPAGYSICRLQPFQATTPHRASYCSLFTIQIAATDSRSAVHICVLMQNQLIYSRIIDHSVESGLEIFSVTYLRFTVVPIGIEESANLKGC
eukprot:1780730-Pleurochrysis_carterae.AAC.1